MNTRVLGALTVLFLTLAAAGALATQASGLDLARLAGLYSYRFPDNSVTDGPYQGVNTLKVVRVSAASAYIDVHIDGYNGHSCDLSGLASAEGSALVFRDKGEAGQTQACVLTIAAGAANIRLSDPTEACQSYFCGARAHLDGATFARASRRPISLLKRLLASDDYKSAVAGQP